MTISVGSVHTCLINNNKEIKCYGNDSYNQVSHTPTSDTYNFISSGYSHNCAIFSTTSQITCWGRGSENQVSHTPTSDTYHFISSGWYHNCAISSSTSKITCWGWDSDNQVSGPNDDDSLLALLWCPSKFLHCFFVFVCVLFFFLFNW